MVEKALVKKKGKTQEILLLIAMSGWLAPRKHTASPCQG
jgi:hypothetical protein